MATRLYTTSTGAPFVVAVDASWEASTAPVVKATLSPKTADYAQQADTAEGATGVANEDKCHFQFFVGPLAAGTGSGTVKGQFPAREASGSSDARAQVVIRAISPAGTVRGTLLSSSAAALSSEFLISTVNTSLDNRKFPLAAISPASLAAISWQDGDYFVIAVGH